MAADRMREAMAQFPPDYDFRLPQLTLVPRH